jgi:4'-phosphopantetheinyl transferase EntD
MDELLDALHADLGPDAALVTADPRVEPAPSLPEEALDVARAVERRRREYAWGRTVAREALAQLGGPRVPLPRQPDRRPVWPEGFTGSISHCADVCAALVVRTGGWAAVGLDVETADPLESELGPLVMTARERARVGAWGVQAKRVFVAKEAYYKAQYPKTGTLLEFADVELELHGQRFRATCERTGLAPLDGRLITVGTHVWAWVGVPPTW